MKDSVADRIRITKRGKIMRRPLALDHFRTRKSTKNLRQKRKHRGLDYPLAKILN